MKWIELEYRIRHQISWVLLQMFPSVHGHWVLALSFQWFSSGASLCGMCGPRLAKDSWDRLNR